MNEDNPVASFEAGDHISLSCNAAGVPYEHHAIVLSAVQEEDADEDDGNGTEKKKKKKKKKWKLCIADFTADIMSSNDDVGDGGSGSVSSGNLLCFESFGSATSSENETNNQQSNNSSKGLRILCINDTTNWNKIHYSTSAPISPPPLIRRRVQFLLQNPHLIPSYSLLESNCECVAVWCKTGKWTTLQAEKWFESTNFGSRVAIAGLSVVSSVGFAIPGAGLLLAAGAVAEVVSGVWGDRVRRGWEEQTKVLNEAFEEDGGN